MSGGMGSNFTTWLRPNPGQTMRITYTSIITSEGYHEFEIDDENGRCPACNSEWGPLHMKQPGITHQSCPNCSLPRRFVREMPKKSKKI